MAHKITLDRELFGRLLDYNGWAEDDFAGMDDDDLESAIYEVLSQEGGTHHAIYLSERLSLEEQVLHLLSSHPVWQEADHAWANSTRQCCSPDADDPDPEPWGHCPGWFETEQYMPDDERYVGIVSCDDCGRFESDFDAVLHVASAWHPHPVIGFALGWDFEDGTRPEDWTQTPLGGDYWFLFGSDGGHKLPEPEIDHARTENIERKEAA